MKNPKATHTGTVRIGDLELPCAVLEDGRRVFTERGMLSALGRRGKAHGPRRGVASKLAVFGAAKNLKPFIERSLPSPPNLVEFVLPKGGVGHGYTVDLLPAICGVFLEAWAAGKLRQNQIHVARRAQALTLGMAHVGIVALVDEATGFQESRRRDALQRILDRYITPQFSEWTRRFPESFYIEIYRLNGWPYRHRSARPSVVGKWTTDLVYDRLAPAVRRELERRNPKDEAGNRQVRHHQYLTADVGHPRLSNHLAGVIALMRASSTWSGFREALNRVYPKFSDTPLFPEMEDIPA